MDTFFQLQYIMPKQFAFRSNGNVGNFEIMSNYKLNDRKNETQK